MGKANSSDSSKFGALLDKYADMVYSIAMTHLIDKSLADDISQNVFLKLVRHFIGLSDEEHIKYWLIRTAVNECISANRKHIRRMGGYSQMNIFAPDETLSADIKMVIEKLPKNYREAVVLCLIDEFSAEEAALILHRNPNTVRSQLTRARKMLREELEGAI